MEKKNKIAKTKKRNKTSIVFNEASRKEFLTGFRKRKNERRRKANEQLEKEYKNEIRKAKLKAKEDVINARETSVSHQIVPEIEHLIQGKNIWKQFSGFSSGENLMMLPNVLFHIILFDV